MGRFCKLNKTKPRMLYASAGSEGRGSPFLLFSQLENTEDTSARLTIAIKYKGGQCDPNGCR